MTDPHPDEHRRPTVADAVAEAGLPAVNESRQGQQAANRTQQAAPAGSTATAPWPPIAGGIAAPAEPYPAGAAPTAPTAMPGAGAVPDSPATLPPYHSAAPTPPAFTATMSTAPTSTAATPTAPTSSAPATPERARPQRFPAHRPEPGAATTPAGPTTIPRPARPDDADSVHTTGTADATDTVDTMAADDTMAHDDTAYPSPIAPNTETAGPAGSVGTARNPGATHTTDIGATTHAGQARVDPVGLPGATTVDRGPAVGSRGRVGAHALRGTAGSDAEPPHDRIRWSAVWVGTLSALGTFLVLQLAVFAMGWLDLGTTGMVGSRTAMLVSGVLSLIAFGVGGLIAAASQRWRGAGTGALHGVAVWALGVTAVLVLVLLGGAALLGGGVAVVAPLTAGVNPEPVLAAARGQAGWAATWLALSLLTAVLGGLLGARAWPGRRADHAHADARG